MKKVLAVSLGDPAGIGPEVALRAYKNAALRRKADFIFCGAPSSVPPSLRAAARAAAWRVIPGRRWAARRPSAASGRLAAASVREAALLVQNGIADAMVTAPLSKEALALAGEPYSGHTEMLAALFGKKNHEVGMLLVGGGLRVFLVTRHLGLKKAIAKITRPFLRAQIRLCASGLKETLGIRRPRLVLAALNPHAGEAGAFGDEEKKILAPVARAEKIAGPLPADTVFVKAKEGAYDAVVCLYHDQGLIPLKLLAFDSGVNITLGLPILRTSPDHGTAYDIAGRGKASSRSFESAAAMAAELA